MAVNPACYRISLMWGAQTGKTQMINCMLAYFISQEPQSQMFMQPSESDLKTWLETKFNAMVESNPVLQERIAKPRGREGVNNQRMKSYPGGWLMFAYSGSSKTMRGRSAPKIFCDETDAYEATAEGDPINLLWQRAATFGDQRLLVDTSTPTVKGASRIEASYEMGDQRHYFMPCFHCGDEIRFIWSQVHWQKDDEGRHMPETAVYVCEHCGSEITHGEKIAMLRKGRWIAEKPFYGHASYHLNELYSRFRTWPDIVQSFLEKKASGDLQSFINVSLAETWEEEGTSVLPDPLYARREPYVELPPEALILTAGVDVQNDSLQVEVVAHGAHEESWGVETFELYGDPGREELWDRLLQAMNKEYPTTDGYMLPIAGVAIDSGGHYTQNVYQFCKKQASRGIWPVKGHSTPGKPIIASVSKNNKAKVNLFMLGVDTAKELLYSRLRISSPGPGYCHFPVGFGYDEPFFDQLTAERCVSKFVKGFRKQEWVKLPNRANHKLDTRVYAIAALKILNPNMQTLLRVARREDDLQSITIQPNIKRRRVRSRGVRI